MNDLCLFVSDLHGKVYRYEKLFTYIEEQKPGMVILGGDLLPSSILHSFRAGDNMPDFVTDYMAAKFIELRELLQEDYPRVYIIFGNDDPRFKEEEMIKLEQDGLWKYLHAQTDSYESIKLMGYSYVPPTPFLLKDWEKYDIAEGVKPGCLHPHEGFFTVQPNGNATQTIEQDLEELSEGQDFSNAICVFHSPPYNCMLDKAALDGVTVEGNPVDPHVGSTAIMDFIKSKRPRVTLHGHIHESSRWTGAGKEKIGDTYAMTAAFEGPELAIVKFHASRPQDAIRIIL
jgi:uncharacterized protein